jgi:hypothetical protein
MFFDQKLWSQSGKPVVKKGGAKRVVLIQRIYDRIKIKLVFSPHPPTNTFSAATFFNYFYPARARCYEQNGDLYDFITQRHLSDSLK